MLNGYQLAPQGRTQVPPLNHAILNLGREQPFHPLPVYELPWAPQLEDRSPGEWTIKPFAKTPYVFQVRALIHLEFTDWSDPVTKIAK